MQHLCVICKQPFEDDPAQHYQKVSGWLKRRGLAGPLRLRREHPEFAHRVCVEHTARLSKQEGLF